MHSINSFNYTLRTLCLLLSIFAAYAAQAQDDGREAVKQFQDKLNEEFSNRSESPLEQKDFKRFKGLPFYPADMKFRVTARLIRDSVSTFRPMKTTTPRLPKYRIYGYVEFELQGHTFRMPVYQGEDLMKKAGYEDYLFFPFTDLTNGETTYGGGRYIDLRIPAAPENLVLDFNQAYNPYCAYSHRYSCPVVPPENHIDLPIEAGVRYEQK